MVHLQTQNILFLSKLRNIKTILESNKKIGAIDIMDKFY